MCERNGPQAITSAIAARSPARRGIRRDTHKPNIAPILVGMFN
jgi:hypothetical protein